MLNREENGMKALKWEGFGKMTPDNYMWVHQFGAYSVYRSGSTVQFFRAIPPACSGRLLPEHQWDVDLGETFLGPEGEIIFKLSWLSDKPDEQLAMVTIGQLEDDLRGWRSWPAAYVPKLSIADLAPQS